MLGPKNTRSQARIICLTPRIYVGSGSWPVDICVIWCQEDKAVGKIVISRGAAAAVVVAGVGRRTCRINRKRHLVDNGVGIGLHLLRRGDSRVPGGVGPRKAPDIVRAVDPDLLSAQPARAIAEVTVAPVVHRAAVWSRQRLGILHKPVR